MHMADALLSPAVGGGMLAVSAGAIGFAVRKMSPGNQGENEKKIPMMGILGAFVFAAQMVNFTIPGTGSSGHIGGGILLAALLGPSPALLTLASVLLIQCLFFADGGLLAWGCNVFNMAVISCLLAYPLVFRPIAAHGKGRARLVAAAVLSSVAGLQLGAFCVVLETVLSGVTELPFRLFVLLMQPIHLAIGLVEGLVTGAVLCYVQNIRPEILESALQGAPLPRSLSFKKMKTLLASFAVLAVLTGGVLSIFASAYPDGLEWSIEKVEKTGGATELERNGPVHEAAAVLVKKTAFMPDYGFAGEGEEEKGKNAGTAAAGVAGCLITVVLAGGVGLVVYAARRRGRPAAASV